MSYIGRLLTLYDFSRRNHCNQSLNNPTRTPPAISHVELSLNLAKRISEAIATTIVSGSTKEARANCQVTAAIKPNEAAVTPSSNPPAQGDARKRGIKGFAAATIMKEGRNIPTVAKIAPLTPPRIYPL